MDISNEMIKIAKKKNNKINFFTMKKKFKEKFDICYSLFHVVSYLSTDKKLDTYLKYVSSNLKENGLLVFDFWYRPSVLLDPAKEKVKYAQEKRTEVFRITKFKNFYKKNILKIFFHFFLIQNKKITQFVETHQMRYYEIKNLNYFLKKNNFNILKSYQWLKFKIPSNKNWYACIIAQYNGNRKL